MKAKHLVALLGMTLPFSSWALNLNTGEQAPEVSVTSHGEVMVAQDDITYHNWDSASMVGKTRVIQAIAGRSAAKALNKPMIDAIIEADFPQDKYQTTTIVNQDDSVWGTGSFVKSSAEDSKREFPHSSIVLDEDGAVAKAWDLEPKTSMIAVQDKDGNILWAKEGELTSTEVQQVITLLKENL
ncbi:protein ytfJ precursor [Vibrio ishigakensis]|uniref:Protein ytfJ n=2 Tax=Vibrio ishigakensis TaxID=1481914 RepID=A0A0B8NXN4_9VIBR|nr:YtfJ family protein [Vibrio ishigakensis]GAM55449.1 protein ytfJ precursor [Vibrio ishigakensis]GAM67586.1 protein ytfJ precursor [Vibrio sp. JCM 19236]